MKLYFLLIVGEKCNAFRLPRTKINLLKLIHNFVCLAKTFCWIRWIKLWFIYLFLRSNGLGAMNIFTLGEFFYWQKTVTKIFDWSTWSIEEISKWWKVQVPFKMKLKIIIHLSDQFRRLNSHSRYNSNELGSKWKSPSSSNFSK